MHIFTVTIETALPPTDRHIGDLMAAYADYHVAAHTHTSGNLAVTITLPGPDLAAAVTRALAIHDAEPISVEAMPEDVRDVREGWDDLPPVVSVTEAAKTLGISRTAVQKRINAGTLPAQQVGREWAVPAGAILP